jgi:hypothetical protein
MLPLLPCRSTVLRVCLFLNLFLDNSGFIEREHQDQNVILIKLPTFIIMRDVKHKLPELYSGSLMLKLYIAY